MIAQAGRMDLANVEEVLQDQEIDPFRGGLSLSLSPPISKTTKEKTHGNSGGVCKSKGNLSYAEKGKS